MRILLFLLFPIFLSAQINRAYGVIEIGATFPNSSSTGPKFAYRPADSSFYRWITGNTWVKVLPDSTGFIMPIDSLLFNATIEDPTVGELKYNSDVETFVFGADGTIIEIGQKTAWYVKNQSGSTIPKGTVVRAAGTMGSSGRILIEPMEIDGTVGSKYLLGIAASSIADGSDGYVIDFGKLRKFNTSAWSDGDVLYADDAGGLTNVEPSPPNLRLPIAFVVHSDATNGVLAIRIQTGNKLEELHDVDTTGIDTNEGLVWNSSKWVASNGKLITSSDTTSILNPYITTAGWGLLKSSKTLRVDSSKVATRYYAQSLTSITSGQIAVGTGSGITGYSSFTYTPGGASISFSSNGGTGFATTNTSSGNLAETRFVSINNLGEVDVRGITGSGYTSNAFIGARSSFMYSNALNGYAIVLNTGSFRVGHGGSIQQSLIATSAGRVGIGSGTPSYIFDINSTDAIRFPRGTDAQEPTSAAGILRYNTTGSGYTGNDGSGRYYFAKSDIIGGGGTNTYIPFFNSNGRLTQSANLLFSNNNTLQITTQSASNSLQLKSVANTPYTGTWWGLSTSGNNGGFLFGQSNNVVVHGGSLGKVEFQGGTGSAGYIAMRINGSFVGTNNEGQINMSPAITINNGAVTGVARGVTLVPSYNFFATAGVTATGLYYNPSLNAMDDVTHRFIESVTGDWYIGSTSGVMGIRTAPDAAYELKLNGDLFVQDSLRLSTTPAHTAITGLLTRDASGWVGLATLGTGLSFSGGVLSNTVTDTWLQDKFDDGDVTVDAYGQNFTFDGLNQFRLRSEGGSADLIFNDDDFTVETGTQVHLNTLQDAHLHLTDEVNLYSPNADGAIGFKTSLDKWVWYFTNTDADEDTAMTVNTTGNLAYLKLHDYGTGQIDVDVVGESPSPYIPIFTPSGSVMEYRLARDTFVEDVTLFSVGSILTYCQEYIITISMTSLAPSDMEVRFPDAAAYLAGKKIIVYSKKKDPGAFTPRIKVVGGVSRLYYTTNPAPGGTDPSDQSELNIDDSTWSDHGVSYEWTCQRINSTDYRWVLKQRQ